MNDQKYYFWLNSWSYRTASYPLFSTYTLCEVDQNGITICDNETPVHIPWNQISKIDSYCNYIPRGAGAYAFAVEIDTKVQKIYLVALNPANSAAMHHKQEHEALVSVIDAFLRHNSPDVHPNPYFRLFERLGKIDYFLLENWNPTISPREYRKHPAIGSAVLHYQKSGFLWAYWIATLFITVVSFYFLREYGKDSISAISIFGIMWLILTAVTGWIIALANRDFSK